MRNTLCRWSVVSVALVMVALACESCGSLWDPWLEERRSASDQDMPQSDLSGCTENSYLLESGTYQPVLGSASIILDSCGTGITPDDLEKSRVLQHDGTGQITVLASDGTSQIGTGPVICNKGTLVYGPISITNGQCRYRAEYVVDFTATSDNRFDMVVTQSRSFTMTEVGMTCTQPQACVFKFKISHKL